MAVRVVRLGRWLGGVLGEQPEELRVERLAEWDVEWSGLGERLCERLRVRI